MAYAPSGMGRSPTDPAPIPALLPTLNSRRHSDPHISFLNRHCDHLTIILFPVTNINSFTTLDITITVICIHLYRCNPHQSLNLLYQFLILDLTTIISTSILETIISGQWLSIFTLPPTLHLKAPWSDYIVHIHKFLLSGNIRKKTHAITLKNHDALWR